MPIYYIPEPPIIGAAARRTLNEAGLDDNSGAGTYHLWYVAPVP
jgi:hypothetical protein